MKTRPATKDRFERPARVCVACHKLPKFCTCKPGAVATCPICKRPESEGQHFPAVDCYPRK